MHLELDGLRQHIAALETENKKYFEIFGMTASEQQENMTLQMDAAHEALILRRTPNTDTSDNDITILKDPNELIARVTAKKDVGLNQRPEN